MGGDQAPHAPVAGALQAARDLPVDVVLVGPAERIRQEAEREGHRLGRGAPTSPLPIVDAPEVIDMAEHPMTAIRSKRRSSMVVGLDLVARGEADGFVTAGNTGAAMAAAIFGLKRLPGIERPALAIPFPTPRGPCLLLDVGANADARAHHLVQFAVMGHVYAERALGIAQPRVALLSIGEEETKGNLAVQEAHRLLSSGRGSLRFVGNVEGKDIPAGLADVVVMDGFVGNVLIKFTEGVSAAILDVLRTEIRANLLTTILGAGLLPAFGRARRRMDYAEYGGAPLLGVNGVCIIGHGRSNPRAVRNAIRVAAQSVSQRVVESIRGGVPDADADPHE